MQEYMLTERETGMLVELLRDEEEVIERELEETGTRNIKLKLQDRLKVVDRLLERLGERDDPFNA